MTEITVTFNKTDPKALGDLVPQVWPELSETDRKALQALIARGISKLFRNGASA